MYRKCKKSMPAKLALQNSEKQKKLLISVLSNRVQFKGADRPIGVTPATAKRETIPTGAPDTDTLLWAAVCQKASH